MVGSKQKPHRFRINFFKIACHTTFMLMAQWTFYNNGFVREADCRVPAGDLALQRGYGIFDFFKTRAGHPVFLDEHLARFYQSAEAMRLPVGKTPAALKAIINELLQKNGLADSGVRLNLTGGVSPDGYTLASPNFIITQHSLQLLSPTTFELGIKLATYPHERQLPHVKTIDYLMPIWLQPWLEQTGADDVLYHQNGRISECPRANFFIVDQYGKIAAPNEHILKGVNRKQVLQLAGSQAAERMVLLEELETAQEAFITSTTKQVLPVTAINGRNIGNGQPGPITRQLAAKLEALIQSTSQPAQQAS